MSIGQETRNTEPPQDSISDNGPGNLRSTDWGTATAVADVLVSNHDEDIIERHPEATEAQKKKIDYDLQKINTAVKHLTIDPNVEADHKRELKSAAQLLSDLRNPETGGLGCSLENLKTAVSNCDSVFSVCQMLWNQPETRNYLQEMQDSSFLEEMIHIGRSYIGGPLKTFPPNVNQNVYADIIRFSLVHCPQTVRFLVNLIVQKDKPITPKDAIREAFKI